MEIYKNRSWRKLCTRSWDRDEENLTCKAMGYSNDVGYGNAMGHTISTKTSNTLMHFNCTSLTECGINIVNKTQLCKVPVRLNGSNIEYGGRVEVFYKGKWGKICPNRWNFENVKVICRQLGFKRAVAEFVLEVKYEDIPFVMSDVTCMGDEPDLASCPRTDGKLNVDCQNNGTGAQALCEPKQNKTVLKAEREVLDFGTSETIHCSLPEETNDIKWFNNKRQVVSSTSKGRMKANKNGALTIKDVQLSDGGTYECRGLENTRYYTIYVNARFTDWKPQQNIIADSSTIISCSAEGTPTPQIEWKRQDEKPLEKGRFVQLSSGSLRVNRVLPQDKGIYSCLSIQSKGSNRVTTNTQNITVSVIIRPVIELLPKGPVHIREGDTANLTCKIIDGLPKPQISWLKDGERMDNGAKTTLILTNVTDEDEGEYTCIAQNVGGSFADRINVRVKISPQIFVSPRNKSVPEGHPAHFSCKARGVPEPTFSWTFNDGVLPSGIYQTSVIEGSFLELPNTTKQMEGIYMCKAENKADVTTSSAYLHVFEKPTAEVSPKPYPKLSTGDELRLTCRVNKATVAIKWKKNDDDVIPRAQIVTQVDKIMSKLIIEEVVEGDSGEYSCEAHNRPGIVASSTVKINVKSVKEKPTAEVSPKPYPKLSTGDELRLTCKVNKATVAIKWRKNDDDVIPRAQITQVDNRMSKLIIEEVVEGDSGEYSCEAHSRPGIVASSTVKINVKSVKGSVTRLALEWYHIGGPVLGCIVIFAVSWYICKRRRAVLIKRKQLRCSC